MEDRDSREEEPRTKSKDVGSRLGNQQGSLESSKVTTNIAVFKSQFNMCCANERLAANVEYFSSEEEYLAVTAKAEEDRE